MISLARQLKEFPLGPFNPSVNVFQWLEVVLKDHIPDNAHQLASGRLAVAVTRMLDRKLTIISSFDSREDVINVSWFHSVAEKCSFNLCVFLILFLNFFYII